MHPLQAEWDAGLQAGDPLTFPGYVPPADESVVTGRTSDYALIHGRFDVMGGSMGAVHGERVVRAFRRAREARLPVVVVASSGGARMQEGMVSLIQLARTASAAREHAAAGLLQVAVLRGPTTGGVYASYASLADVRVAEPGATIGFAGPRVVELTTGERLGPGTHTAEAALRHGLVDALATREQQRGFVETALGLTADSEQWEGADKKGSPAASGGPVSSAWDEVLAARHPERPSGDRWAAAIIDLRSWTPLRAAPPDPCVSAGLASIGGRRVVIIAMNRHRPRAAGYRLAQRAAGLAGRLGVALVTLVDTPGADPSPASEAEGIAGEIARTFAALDALPTVSVAVCVGEGGSGGALAVAHCDRLLLLEHAVFSVISPEGAAAILDRSDDASAVAQRAENLKLRAADLLELGIIDEVIREEATALRRAISRAMDDAEVGDRRRRIDAATGRWLR